MFSQAAEDKKRPRIMTLADLRKEGNIPRQTAAPTSTAPRGLGIFDNSLEMEAKQLREQLNIHTEKTWKMISNHLYMEEKTTPFRQAVSIGTHLALMYRYNLQNLLEKVFSETSASFPRDPYQINFMRTVIQDLPELYSKSKEHCPPAKLLTTPDEIANHHTGVFRANISSLIAFPLLYLYWSSYPASSVIGWKGLSYLVNAGIFWSSYNNTAAYHNDHAIKDAETKLNKVKDEIKILLNPLAAHLEKGQELSEKLVATLEKQGKPITHTDCLALKEQLRQRTLEKPIKHQPSMTHR